MAKIIAHYSKKLPLAEYANQEFRASIEVDIDDTNPETLKAGLRRMFSMAKESVDEQFRGCTQNGTQNPNPTAGTHQAPTASRPTTRNGQAVVTNGRQLPATHSQKKAVFAISKSLGLDPAQFNIDSLTVKAASQLIDQLKSQQTGN